MVKFTMYSIQFFNNHGIKLNDHWGKYTHEILKVYAVMEGFSSLFVKMDFCWL